MLVFIDERDPVVLVASAVDTVDRSGSYTFAGLNFGDDFTGRTIVAVAFLMSPNYVVLDQTSCTIGGVSADGNDAGVRDDTTLVGACGCGIWAAKPSGTSGTVTVNFTSGTATACQIYILALADVASTTATDTTPAPELTSTAGIGSSKSTTVNVPSDGVLIMGMIRTNTTALTLVGVTERIQETVSTNYRVAVGWDFRLSSETGRTVGYTSGNNAIYGGFCCAFT